jgi:hypothetical protein
VRRRDGEGSVQNGYGDRGVPGQDRWARLESSHCRLIEEVRWCAWTVVGPVTTIGLGLGLSGTGTDVLRLGSSSGSLGVGEHPAHLDKLPSILPGRPGQVLQQLIRREEPLPRSQPARAQLPPGPVRQRLRHPHLPGLHQTS